MVLVVAGDFRGGVVGLRFHVPDAPRHAVEGVDGTLQQIVRNPVDVAAVREPLAPRRDVVRGALALGLDEKRQFDEVLAVPGGEGFEQPDAFGVGAYLDFDLFIGRKDAAFHFLYKALLRQFFALRGLQLIVGTVGRLKGALQGIEGEVARNRHRHHDFGRGEEGVRLLAAVVAAGEVAVEGFDDGVRFRGVADRALPLTDAGAAGVGEHRGVQLFKVLENTVALEGFINPDAARHHKERGLEFNALFDDLFGD